MNCWHILNIEPTSDESALKKAYRAQLRHCHPEENPEGFKQLREAYDTAVQYAKRAQAGHRPSFSLETELLDEPSSSSSQHDRAESPVPECMTDPESTVPPAEPECEQEPNLFEPSPDKVLALDDPRLASARTIELETEPKTWPLEKEHTSEVLLAEFDVLMGDPTRRFQMSIWQNWLMRVQLLSLADQQHIANALLPEVLKRGWLPGKVVGLFWQELGWQLLHQGDPEEQRMAIELEQWSKETEVFPLELLMTLPHGHQVSLLRFSHTLQQALQDHMPGPVRYLLRYVGVMPLILEPKFILLLLQAFRAGDIWPQYVLVSLLEPLIESYLLKMDADELVLVSEICRKTRQERLLRQVIDRMMDLNLMTEVTEQMYQWYYETNIDLGLGFAYLFQQWRPQIPAFWVLQRRFAKMQPDPQKERRRAWLYNALQTMSDASPYEHPYQFRHSSQPAQWMASGLWTGSLGSWRAMRDWSAPEIADTEADSWAWNLMMQVIKRWLQYRLTRLNIPQTMQDKLSFYETDSWFQSSSYLTQSLTEEEFQLLSPEQWLDLYRRHPFIPQRWFISLLDMNLLSVESIGQDQNMPRYVKELSYLRLEDSDFEAAIPWQQQIFKGCFEWAVRFYAQLGDARKVTSDGPLPLLPESLNGSLLAHYRPFMASDHHLRADLLPALEADQDHPVGRIIFARQIELMAEQVDEQVLLDGIAQHRAVDMLAWALRHHHSDFNESVIAWNLVKSQGFPILESALLRLWDLLKQSREALGLERMTYDLHNEQLVHSFLHFDRESMPDSDQISRLTASPAAKGFIHPMILMCALLREGISPQVELHMKEFNALENRALLSPPQLLVADYGYYLLEAGIQRLLAKDIEQAGGKRVPRYHLKGLHVLGLITGAASILYPGHPSWHNLLPDLSAVTESDWGQWGFFAVLLLLNFLMMWRMLRLLDKKVSRQLYLWLTAGIVYWALESAGFGSGVVLFLWHFCSTHLLSDVRSNGCWESGCLDKKGQFSLRKVMEQKVIRPE